MLLIFICVVFCFNLPVCFLREKEDLELDGCGSAADLGGGGGGEP